MENKTRCYGIFTFIKEKIISLALLFYKAQFDKDLKKSKNKLFKQMKSTINKQELNNRMKGIKEFLEFLEKSVKSENSDEIDYTISAEEVKKLIGEQYKYNKYKIIQEALEEIIFLTQEKYYIFDLINNKLEEEIKNNNWPKIEDIITKEEKMVRMEFKKTIEDKEEEKVKIHKRPDKKIEYRTL